MTESVAGVLEASDPSPHEASPAARRASLRAAVAIACVGVAVLLASALVPTGEPYSLNHEGDVKRYFGYAQLTFEGEVPYRDFLLEYPPGFLPVILAPGPADEGYFDRFRTLTLLLGAAVVVLLVAALFRVGASAAELAAAVLVFATVPRTLTPDLVFDRFDLWPAVLVLVAVVGLLTRRTLGLAALGLAVAAKVYPLVLVPLALLMQRGRVHLRRDIAVIAAAALALTLPFALLAPRGVARVGWLLVKRDLHVESLGGSILLVAKRFDIYEPTVFMSYGVGNSWDLAGPAAKVVAVAGTLVGAVAIATVWLLFARGPRGHRELLLAVAACVVGFVAFGKVLSPQYMVWVAAAVPLALGRVTRFVLPAAVVSLLLTRAVYREGYFDMLEAGRWSWVLLARNLLLVGIFAALVLELASRARARAPARMAAAAAAP